MFSFKLENEFNEIVDINDGEHYFVIDASGITPPSASVFTTKSYNKIGVRYNGSSVDERQIDITIKIMGDIEENRNYLYKWVDTQQKVKIYYQNGLKNVYCEGYVESCDVPLFTDNECFNISIVCPDPYWKALQDIVVLISDVEKQFTFPFAIDEVGIPFSTLKDNTITSINNYASETGIVIDVLVLNDISKLSIKNPLNPTEVIELKAGKTLKKGDHLVIDTTTIPRKITLNGVNFLNGVKPNIYWFDLKRGVNYFMYETTNNSDIIMKVKFAEKYLGV